MAYVAGNFDQRHLYLQWGGKLPGNEQWSCGLRMVSVSPSTAAYTSGMHDIVRDAVTAYHSSDQVYLSPRALLSFVKLNAIGIDGQYEEETTNERVIADVPGGGVVSQTPANQICHVVSLTTGYSRGAAHRGRFYLPLPTNAIDTAGVISASSAGQVGTATDTFLASLNGASSDWKVAVMSRKSGAATNRLVTGCEIGRVYDTQRRRRRSLVEGYV